MKASILVSSLLLLPLLLLVAIDAANAFKLRPPQQQQEQHHRPLHGPSKPYPELCNKSSASQRIPYCNTSLSIDARVEDFLNRVPLKDLAKLTGNTMLGIDEPFFPGYQVWSESLHGVAYSPGVHFTEPTPCASSFPMPSLTGASFDKNLFCEIGRTTATEGRAMNNVGNSGLSFWSPNINRQKSQWGRNLETPGESDMLISHYVKNYVRGAQNNSMDPTRLFVSFCAKHQILYDLENWGGHSRHTFDAKVSQHDFDKYYSLQFEAAMKSEGGAASGMMCSYNAETIVGDSKVQNVPSCANKEWITETLRGDYKADFYSTSDCGAVEDVYKRHKYVSTPEEAINATLSAGMNSNCGEIVPLFLNSALSKGIVSPSLARNSLKPLFRTLMRLGVFDPFEDQPFKKLGPRDVDSPEARRLAHQVAVESIVLLDYDSKNFPLSLSKHKKIAVLGPHFNATVEQLGNYYGKPPYIISPLQGIAEAVSQTGGSVVGLQGCDETKFDALQFDNACNLVKDPSVDAVVLAMGISTNVESEGHDRTALDFPGLQNLFVKTMRNCVATASPTTGTINKPIIVVAQGGSSLDWTPILKIRGISAKLHLGYAGQSAGTALADILFGNTAPSGRLPFMIYPASYAYEVAPTDMRMESDQLTDFPGRTYLFYVGTPVYDFGHGKQLTTFSVSLVSQSSVVIPDDLSGGNVPRTLFKIANVTFKVKNTGTSVTSKFSLLFHVMPPQPHKFVRPPLADFAKTSNALSPGESEVLTVSLPLSAILDDSNKAVKTGKYSWTVTDSDVEGDFIVR